MCGVFTDGRPVIGHNAQQHADPMPRRRENSNALSSTCTAQVKILLNTTVNSRTYSLHVHEYDFSQRLTTMGDAHGHVSDRLSGIDWQVDEISCEDDPKPEVKRRCNVTSCYDDADWIISEWSKVRIERSNIDL